MSFEQGNPLRMAREKAPAVSAADAANVTLRKNQKKYQKPSIEKAHKYKVSETTRPFPNLLENGRGGNSPPTLSTRATVVYGQNGRNRRSFG